MDFLNGKIKTIYFKYLAAAFGSALITSIYSIVDMAMVGQYHGPEGSAALAVVAPVWGICYLQHDQRKRERAGEKVERILYCFGDRICDPCADHLDHHHPV